MPDLPSLFGNPVLRGWHEVLAPPAIDWIPRAPGWLVLATLAVLWFSHRARQGLRRWLRRRYRREALRRLTANNAGPEIVNEILKLAAMQASSRAEVAALSGSYWTRWLNQRTPKPVFSPESCHALEQAPYRGQQPAAESDLVKLHRQAALWLKHHRDDHEPA